MKTAEQMKFDGLEKASSKYAVDLARAKHIAELLGMLGKPVTADDVREAFFIREGRALLIGNAMGKLFLNKKKWEFVGFVRSARLDSHARTIRRWGLKGYYRP